MDEKKKFNHAEAFCLMMYAGKDGSIEWLWNSRDGVTPFSIDSGSDYKEHVHWNMDCYCPLFVPPIGMRIFIDLTPEMALVIETEKVEHYWDHPKIPMREHPTLGPLGKEEAAKHLAARYQKGEPAVVVVDEALRALFEAKV